jgi:membrane associated rhomboid family serine protease
MKEAPVGFQCPECVKEGQKGARAARTTFGGTARPDDTPVITYALIALNVLVFVVAAASSDALGGTLTPLHRRFANLATALPWPNGDGSVTVYQGVSGGEYYRLITAMFFHFGVAHIAFNMLALFSLGPRLEQLFGRARFLALYFGAGFCGNVCTYVLAKPGGFAAGASTAIFGLFGAYFVVAKRMRADTSQIVGLLAINLVITFVVPNIDWRGHIGGLVGGGLIAAALVYAPRDRRTVIQAVGTMLVIGLAVALVAVRTASLS